MNRGGEQEAEELHRAYRAPLVRFFSRRVRDSSVSEDLAQQVFERLLKRGNLGSIGNMGAYVFQAARSVIASHARGRGRDPDAGSEQFDENLHGDVDFSPEHVLLKREKLARALDALDSLPERTREIFVLRRIEGEKYRDIAERFGISVSAVEKHMERAIARLLETMEEKP